MVLHCILSTAILFMVATTCQQPKGQSATEMHVGVFTQWNVTLCTWRISVYMKKHQWISKQNVEPIE